MKHLKLFEQENFDDPFGEESNDGNINITTEKQKRYLTLLAMKLANFKNSYNELNTWISTAPSSEININDFISENYPFDRSFDEIDIDRWYDSIRDKYRQAGV